tara:strand:+ start:432 stop:1178 length:747 start_codon:yes stop_codon:yes gene_type:complete
MAISVDTIYQKVLTLSNKEQRGYITPQEFNLLADKAQLEIFENYFHDIKTAQMKPMHQANYADNVEMISEKLHSFHIDTTVYTSSASLTLPTSIYKLIDITRSGNKVTPVEKNKISYIQNNPLTSASVTRSIFVREDSGSVTIYPPPSSSTYNVVSSTGVSGLNNDTESFEVSYYKRPSTPNWTYVVVLEQALYNSTDTELQDFELAPSEEENLVNRILQLAGVTIKQPDVQQAAMTDIQIANQEKNN